MTALSGYLWHSPEPLWELGLADNKVTDKGVEELLRRHLGPECRESP